ncbi:hypothetical protein TIFTF001_045270 [Ficus carica]|uniref:Uncharacterized protein n=1 Tax=Ficus carica TaxID=3494 RepID=A0AA87YVN0_FICCA|nr:hypothetical protein TIFTF001_045270 [Ficus carica]
MASTSLPRSLLIMQKTISGAFCCQAPICKPYYVNNAITTIRPAWFSSDIPPPTKGGGQKTNITNDAATDNNKDASGNPKADQKDGNKNEGNVPDASTSPEATEK